MTLRQISSPHKKPTAQREFSGSLGKARGSPERGEINKGGGNALHFIFRDYFLFFALSLHPLFSDDNYYYHHSPHTAHVSGGPPWLRCGLCSYLDNIITLPLRYAIIITGTSTGTSPANIFVTSRYFSLSNHTGDGEDNMNISYVPLFHAIELQQRWSRLGVAPGALTSDSFGVYTDRDRGIPDLRNRGRTKQGWPLFSPTGRLALIRRQICNVACTNQCTGSSYYVKGLAKHFGVDKVSPYAGSRNAATSLWIGCICSMLLQHAGAGRRLQMRVEE